MASPKKYVPFVVVLVLFVMLLISRGLGLQTIMDPIETRIIFLIQMLLGLAAIVVLLTRRQDYRTEAPEADEDAPEAIPSPQFFLSNETPAHSVSDFLAQHANVLAVYIFGGGSVALNFGYLYVEFQCMAFFREDGDSNTTGKASWVDAMGNAVGNAVGNAWRYASVDAWRDAGGDDSSYRGAVVQFLGTLFLTIIIIIEIPLLHYFTTITHCTRRSLVTKGAILMLMGANVSIWLITFLDETHLLEVLPFHENTAHTVSLRNACLTHSDITDVFMRESLEKVLFPFSMEFCITSMEILYHVYFATVIVERRRHRGEWRGESGGIEGGVSNPGATLSPDEATLNAAGATLTHDGEATLVHEVTLTPAYKRTLQRVQDVCRSRGVTITPLSLDQLPGENDANEMYEVVDQVARNGNANAHLDGDGDAIADTEVLVRSQAAQAYVRPSAIYTNDQDTVIAEIILPGDEPRQPSKSLPDKIRARLISLNTPVTALIFGIIEALLIKFFLLHAELVEHGSSYVTPAYVHYHCAVPLIVFCIVVDGIPLLSVTVHCLRVLCQFPHRRRNPPPFKNSIILALTGITVLCCMKFTVPALKLIKSWNGNAEAEKEGETTLQLLTILETIVFFPQFFLQSLVLYDGQRRLADPSHVHYSTLQGALSYIAMNNFMHWGINSFLETEYLMNRLELQRDAQWWNSLVLLFTPTFIFYYFISTLMLLQVMTMLADSGRPWQTWVLSMKFERRDD